MIALEDVIVLIGTIEAGSLSAAGRRIGITAMAASRKLAALETELGVRLVHRTTRALSLTPEGEAFLPHARALVEQEAEARAAVRPAEAGANGLLRITASVPFGRKLVMPMIADCLGTNPDLRIELILDDGLVDMAANGIDLALRIGALRDSSLVARRLADNPRGLYAAPAYIARYGKPLMLADLAGHECLVFPGTTHWMFERAGRFVQQHIGGRFATDSVEGHLQSCMDGLGIARLSNWNVLEEVAQGRLVQLTLSDAAMPEEAIWAVYPSPHFVPAKVRVFIDAFHRHLRHA